MPISRFHWKRALKAISHNQHYLRAVPVAIWCGGCTCNFPEDHGEPSPGGSIPQVTVYIDDILITRKSEEEHLAEVLQRLKGAGMWLKESKCCFLLPEVEYLGHQISSKGQVIYDMTISFMELHG